MADPLWRDLLKHSNEGKYAEFVEKFARPLALAMNEVVVNHQFANSELRTANCGTRQFRERHASVPRAARVSSEGGTRQFRERHASVPRA